MPGMRIYGQDGKPGDPGMLPAIDTVFSSNGSRIYPGTPYPGVPAEVIDVNQAPPAFADDPYVGGISLFKSIIPSPDRVNELINPTGQADIVWWDYWDSIAVPTASTLSTKLFTTAKDATANGNLVGANGTLQGTEIFLIDRFRCELERDTATEPMDATDVYQIFRTGTYEIWVQNKMYMQGKLLNFLNPEAPIIVGAGGAGYFQENPFMSKQVAIQIAIGSRNSFYVVINITTTPTLTGNWKLFFYLTGALYRGVQ